jgi:hypothetical protein
MPLMKSAIFIVLVLMLSGRIIFDRGTIQTTGHDAWNL